MELITILYLFFVLSAIYIYSFFLLLYFKNRKELFNDTIEKNLPTLTVLIPAYNEEKTISNTLNVVLSSNYPKNKLEVIVINDGSTDKTESLVKQFPKVKLISKQNSGKADSLNQGIKLAKGEFIAIVDADSYPEKDAFQKVISTFKNPNIAAVTVAVRVHNTSKFLTKMQLIEYTMIAWVRKLLQFINSVYVTPGALSIYRKNVLEKIGGFDKNIITEDIEIAWRILREGYEIKMCLSARVFTTVPDKLKKWWRQRLRWDIGGIQTAVKHKDTVLKPKFHMVGIFVFPFFVSAMLLSILGFFIFLYLISTRIIRYILITKFSIITHSSTLQIKHLYLTPSIFMLFGIILVTTYLIYLTIGLKKVDKQKIDLKKKANIICYLFLYLTLYPILFLQSIYMYLTNNIKW